MAKPKVDKGTGLSKEDCIALGKKALSSFTDDELHDYVSEVYAKAKTYQDVTGIAAIKKAIGEISQQAKEDLFHQCTKTANNVAKFEPKADLIRSGKSDLRNILVPRGKGQGQSLDGAQKAGRATLYDSFFDETWNQEKEAMLINKKNDISVYDALDGKDASPEAKTVAKHVERYRDVRNSESVRSNAVDIEHLSQYKYLDHLHDESKMMNGGANIVQRAANIARGKKSLFKPKEAWLNYVKERLNLEAMFEGSKGVGIDGELDHAYIDQILGRTYDNIINGRSEMFTRSLVANDREAVKRKKRMFLYFKDWRSWGEYNEKYGQGSLVDALMADIRKSGGRIGTADFMGTNPHGMFMDLKKMQLEVQPEIPMEEGFLAKGKKKLSAWDKNNEYNFNYLLGANPSSVRPTLTNFMASLRSFITANRAPYISLTSITDQSHILEYIGHYGVNRAKGQLTLMATLFNNKMADISFPERKIFAKQMAYLLKSHIGFMAKALDSQSVGSWMNHIGEGMFKLFGTKAIDEGHLTSALWLMSDNIARHSDRAWESIPDAMRQQFEDFNISKEEWNLLRGKTKNRLFSVDNVDSLTDKELREYYETTDKSIPLTQLRNELYRKVYSMFDVAAQNCILNPTSFSRANIYGDMVPGEYKTEVLRHVMNMKSFSMEYIDRVWRQGLNRNPGLTPKLMFAMRLMAMSMPLAAMSSWFYNFSQGKSTDLTDPKFLIDSALPGMGMFLNILDPKKNRTDLMFGLARSPSMTLISNMVQAPMSLIHGDTKAAKKHFAKAIKYLLPYETIPFLAPFIRDMLGEKSYLQPGQHQLFGA